MNKQSKRVQLTTKNECYETTWAYGCPLRDTANGRCKEFQEPLPSIVVMHITTYKRLSICKEKLPGVIYMQGGV